MRKRVISLTLALFYFSVSLAFSTPHFHDSAKGLPHQCAACAWHFESTADAPTGPIRIAAPEILVAPERPVEFRVFTSVPILHRDRGPPRFS